MTRWPTHTRRRSAAALLLALLASLTTQGVSPATADTWPAWACEQYHAAYGVYPSGEACASYTGATTTTTTAPTTTTTLAPAAGGQTYWADGTIAPKTAPSGVQPISAYATGALPNSTYALVTGRNGCTTDIRGAGPNVVSDGSGNIPTTSGTVNEGGYAREDGTYDVCFARPASSYGEPTAPVQITVGGSATTTTAPTTTTTVAPTTTTTVPPTTTTTIPPAANTCAISPADGQAAISAAIAACPDGTASAPTVVSFPAAQHYTQTDRIYLPDRNHLVIDGNGSTFTTNSTQTAPGHGNFVVLRGVNITFQEVIARGPFDQAPVDGKYSLNYPAGIGWEPNAAFGFFGTNGGGVRDSQAHHLWGDGVMMAFDGILDDTVQCSMGVCNWQVSRNLVIERMLVDNVARTCWAPTNVQNVTIQDSTCLNAWMSGIDAEADGDWDGNVNNNLPVDGLKVLRNTFDGYNIAAIAVPVGGDAWQSNPADRTVVGNVEIRGNDILSIGTIGSCSSPILIGLAGYDARNRIQNVTVDDNDVAFFAVAVEFNHVDGGAITGNRFHYDDLGLYGGPDIQCDPGRRQAVIVNDSTNVTVTSNTTVQ